MTHEPTRRQATQGVAAVTAAAALAPLGAFPADAAPRPAPAIEELDIPGFVCRRPAA